MRTRLALVHSCAALASSLTAPAASSLTAPEGPQSVVLLEEDFEAGALAEPPVAWFGPTMGPRGELVDEGAFEGARCARIDLEPDGEQFGNLLAGVPVDLAARSRVLLRAAVRVGGAAGGRAQLWLRFDYDDGESVLADNMADRPIAAGGWAEHRIVADVLPKPGRAVVGLMAFDGARADLDAVRLEVLGASPTSLDPPRALSERGLANLTAFARLYGVVRWFHPSDAAAAADWELFAVEGARSVEGAGSAEELRDVLRALFSSVAPGLAIHRAGDAPPLDPALAAAPEGRFVRVRSWRHRGMGEPERPSPIYSSRRRNDRVRDGALPDGVPDPAAPLRVPLGEGLVADVPLALYSTRDGTLPPAGGPAAWEAGEMLALTGTLQPEFVPEDRATRLGAVVIAWNVFQHFYPYFDVVDVDWPAELGRALAAAAEDADAQAFGHTLQRLVAALRDGHGGVYHPSLMQTGRLPLGWALVDGELVVTWVDGTIADRLAPGDVVEKIGFFPARQLVQELEARTPAATPQFRRFRVCEELLQGAQGEFVELRLRREDGGPGYRLAVVECVAPRAGMQEPRRGPVEELEPGVWYVDLDAATTEEFLEHLDEIAAARGVVFDLRGYPDGFDAFRFFPHLVREPVESPRWLIPILTRPDRAGVEYERSNWTVEPAEPYIAARRVFITDGRAISYAESCMGIVEHYRLGEIVGEATAGTNGNVNPFGLPGGYAVSWTGMRVCKQDGAQHHGVGVRPTIPVARTREGIAAGRDELLEAALAALER